VNIVSLSLCYPTSRSPNGGLFVQRRLQALAAFNHVRVVSPVPMFPGITGFAETRRTTEPIPHWEPPMPYVPGLSGPFNAWLYARSVARLLSDWSRDRWPDIIDAHFCWPDGVAAQQIAGRLNLPYAVTLRGVLHRYVRHPMKRRRIIDSLRRASAVIAVSESLKQDAIQLGVSPGSIQVIPNGVNADVFAPGDIRSARLQLGRDPNETIIVSVGHLCRRKGFHRVLRVLPKMILRHAGLRYVIIGADASEGRFESELRRTVRRLNLSDRVTFTGNLKPTNVATWLQAADVFVLPTENEGSCNAICEALACGLSVVTTDVGGNRDHVSTATGTLVPLDQDDALVQAIDALLAARPDRSVVAQIGAGRSWERVAHETAAALRNAVAKHAPRHRHAPLPA
jgi:glycosyltransferase involved in cell wall biosynthesis